MGGSKGSRLGVLFSANQDTDLPGLLFVKVFEITASSYRLSSVNTLLFLYNFFLLHESSVCFDINPSIACFMILCSHKKNVLNFLDHLCSFYEKKYILASSGPPESMQPFIDKVYELAAANELSLTAYKSVLPEFSVDKMREHLNKVIWL